MKSAVIRGGLEDDSEMRRAAFASDYIKLKEHKQNIRGWT